MSFLDFTPLLKKFTDNPMGLFVKGILAKWNFMLSSGALIVVFLVFKNLPPGLKETLESTLTTTLQNSKAVAQNCVPLMGNVKMFWACLNDTPAFQDTDETRNFEQDAQKYIDNPLDPQLPRDPNKPLNTNRPYYDNNQTSPYDD